ncbi:uncharacterized protein LOC141631747 [Silene latifolia]|uniref:uncharacterized protein LOC141631747 n=1 Tax=Silene latifolia TaxID=37657 RepID=UPI003D788D60
MTIWYELCLRLKTNTTIDEKAQGRFQKEKKHWKNVLLRIISIVKFLGKHNLAFRGSNSKLYEDSNGNFLGLVEMLVDFDPIMQEHVSRIVNKDTHVHYLGHNIKQYLRLREESCCVNLENMLKNNNESDIEGKALCFDLKIFREFMPKKQMGPIAILNYMKQVGGCFPNAVIAYRILLTILVTVASAERSFSKLKLLKSYLRSTMLQDRLNGLAMIAIENNLLEKVTYDELIEEFASENATRALLLARSNETLENI